MRCPNCQKIILDNVKQCPYCGQAVQRQPLVQDMFEASPSPMAGSPAAGGIPPAEHHEAVRSEVKKRHWQRWLFYVLIIAIVGGSVGLMLKIYSDNTSLLLAVSKSQEELTQKATELAAKDQQIKQIDENLKKVQDDLNAQATKYKTDIEGQAVAVKDAEQCKLALTASDANIYNLILTVGTGISKADINKIMIADSNLGIGVDTDGDGLSDEVEMAIGTDISKDDSDGDTYKDKAEVIGGFDPLKAGGNAPINQNYANAQKGRIIIQVEGDKAAWYVSPADGKRYFLGHPGDAYKAMRSIEFWTKDFKKQ